MSAKVLPQGCWLFYRSVTYTINGFHKNHVTVMAEVVCVGLELSTENLVLMPTLGLPADAGVMIVIKAFVILDIFFP